MKAYTKRGEVFIKCPRCKVKEQIGTIDYTVGWDIVTPLISFFKFLLRGGRK